MLKETYYSDVLDKHFDSKEEAIKAEDAYEKKQLLIDQAKEEKRLAAKKVEDAFKAAAEAKDGANKVLADFCEKYGPYHQTIKGDSLVEKPFGLFDLFFDNPFFY